MTKAPFLLVVDDDADDKFLFKSVFDEKESDVILDFVSNGVELLHYLDHIKSGKRVTPYPTLILLDLNMPKMNGKEALKKIKEDPAYSKIELAIFSTTNNEREIKLCYELGADSYIVKPSSYDSFVKIVDSIIGHCTNFFQSSGKLVLG